MKKKISLSSVIKIYRKRGMSIKEATRSAKFYMMGYTAAKKGSSNSSTAKKWSKKDRFGRIKKR